MKFEDILGQTFEVFQRIQTFYLIFRTVSKPDRYRIETFVGKSKIYNRKKENCTTLFSSGVIQKICYHL